MIVIAIIGILAAALFPSLTAYLKRSRDAGRSANLNTIATAIGAFYSDKERYPHGSAIYVGCVFGADDSFTGTNYFPKGMPNDPLGTTAQSTCGTVLNTKAQYGYGHSGSATTKADIGYVVSAVMENLAWGNFKGAATATFTGSNADPITIATLGTEKGTGSIYVLTN